MLARQGETNASDPSEQRGRLVSRLCRLAKERLTATVAVSGQAGVNGPHGPIGSPCQGIAMQGVYSVRIGHGFNPWTGQGGRGGARKVPAAEKTVEEGIDIEAIGQMDPEPGGGRVVGPEREERLRNGHQPEGNDGQQHQRPFQRPGCGVAGSVPCIIVSAMRWSVK